MAKKKKKFQETTIENFYDLKVDKVNELVAALKDDNPDDSDSWDISMNISDCTGTDDPKNVGVFGRQKKFNPYKGDFLSRIPCWLKAIFIKWWFAGVVCYFFMWGIGGLTGEDKMLLTGLVLGLFVDVLVNPLFRYMETEDKEYNAYMMFPFPFKAFWTFFTNLIYYVIVMFCVSYCYAGLNELINHISHRTEELYIAVGVEPLLFGTFCVIVDMVFIGIKDGIVYLVRKLRKKEKTANV